MAERDQRITNTVAQYGKQLKSFIRTRVDDSNDADDLLQEVWFQLSRVADLSTIGSISGWLYKVARNKITDLFRRKKPESLESFTVATEDGDVDFKDLLLADYNNTDDVFFKEHFWKELMDALNELPANQREVFVLHEVEEMPLKDIAALQHENIKTIISRKGYAVKFLRNRLQKFYNNYFT